MVINIRTNTQAVYEALALGKYQYCGRGSKWGNPFTHLYSSKPGVIVVGSREEAIERYEPYILAKIAEDPETYNLEELRGMTLGCYCKPKACHCDILQRLAGEISAITRGDAELRSSPP